MHGPLAQAAAARGLVMTEATAEQIRKLGRRSLALKCDVTDEEQQVEAAVSQTVEEFGWSTSSSTTRDITDHVGQLVDQSHELGERDLRVNLTGAFQLLARGLLRRSAGGADREHGLGRRGLSAASARRAT